MKYTLKQALRWTILAVSFIFALFLYGLWRAIETEIVGYSIISSILRGVVVFGFLYWVWHLTKRIVKTKPKNSGEFSFILEDSPATKPEANNGTAQK